MPIVTLADSSQRHFPNALTVLELAHSISPSLAKATLAALVDEKQVDTSFLITSDVKVRLLTEKDPESLAIIRHSTAHLLAHAVKELYPQAQVTIGPVVEDGFYYDFSCDISFTPEILSLIEQRMLEIVKRQLPVERLTWSREEAIAYFTAQGEHYKVKIIESIPSHETLSLYKQGDFIDVCRGPHVPNLKHLKVFKLTKLAGAYWRGDSNNEMLQRIYGTAWLKPEELASYLKRLEEAEKRDHRRIGKALDLFHIQEEGPGMVFWHPHGWTLYRLLETYIRERTLQDGYREVKTPQILDRVLWEKSGHWEKFKEDMFITESEKRTYAIKPMSCPGHVQIFNHTRHSYRDLPLRFSEFGCCHRNEPSGALHGLFRVRNFTQDDGHIFCTEDQIQSEAAKFIALAQSVYEDFGFSDLKVILSTRPEKRVGSDEIWDKAEEALAEALKKTTLAWRIAPGDGAFYGPKIEFQMTDCMGRLWTCGSLQLDFSIPERLEASYVTEENGRATPVMLHRAILGSLERFAGILLEHHAGILPVWLAPIQVSLLTITTKQDDFARFAHKKLSESGFRAKIDLRNEKIGFKIREHTLQRVPFQVVIGEREAANSTVSVRTLNGKDLGSMSLEALISLLTEEVAQKSKTIESI